MSIYSRDYVDSNKGTRLPSNAYKDRNGFFERSSSSSSEVKASEEDLARHRTAMYILTQKDRPIPSLDEMKKSINEPDTSAKLKELIKARKEQHIEDLERVYEWHAKEYLEEAHDQYFAWDEAMCRTEGENNFSVLESSRKLESLYSNARRAYLEVVKWQDDLELLNHTHLRHLQILHKWRIELEAREEEEKIKREAEFPQTIEEFRSKKKEVQYRAAKLLSLPANDIATQERLAKEYGWARSHIRPLKEIFNKDKIFNGEILSLLITKNMATSKDSRRSFQ